MSASPGRPAAWPTRLEFNRRDRVLTARFDDGGAAQIPFELLRVESPSAEVQGHGAAGKRLVAGKRRVGVARAEPVGNYAVRITFDDGHDSGLFTWDYLARLGRDGDQMLSDYAARLAEAGLSRDPG